MNLKNFQYMLMLIPFSMSRWIVEYIVDNYVYYIHLLSGFGGLEVACWPLVPKFVGSHLAEAVKFLVRKKSSAHFPSEGK